MSAAPSPTPNQWEIAPAMREPLERLAILVGELFSDQLAGLTVYGSALSPGFDDSRMTAATALVVMRTNLPQLKALAGRGPTLGRMRIAAPLVLTESFIAGSADSFPLELLEIQQRRRTLLGRDCFTNVVIQPEHVRLQCEREFKRMLIRMQQGLLAAAGRDDVLDDLERDVAAHLLRTLRGLLWLEGRKDFVDRQTVVDECERLLNYSLPGVRSALQLHLEHGWADFQALYQDVEKLAATADQW